MEFRSSVSVLGSRADYDMIESKSRQNFSVICYCEYYTVVAVVLVIFCFFFGRTYEVHTLSILILSVTTSQFRNVAMFVTVDL
jgi:hypothetical protein